MLVSGVQQSDLVIHIHISILFLILFPYRLLQSIEYSSLCYTVGPCWLSILHILVCICQSQPPNSSLPFIFSPWQSQVRSLLLFYVPWDIWRERVQGWSNCTTLEVIKNSGSFLLLALPPLVYGFPSLGGKTVSEPPSMPSVLQAGRSGWTKGKAHISW